MTADFRRSPGDAVKDLYRQAAPFLTKEITLRNHAVYTPFIMTPSVKKMAEKEDKVRKLPEVGVNVADR